MPNRDEITDWVYDKIDAGEVAMLSRKPLTRMEMRKGSEENKWDWAGPVDAIIIVGYPYMLNVPIRNEEGKKISDNYSVAGFPFDVKSLVFLPEYHGFACVRTDVYNVTD